jgi:hypothetical protein
MMGLLSWTDRRISSLRILAACGLLLSFGSQSLGVTFGLSPVPLHFLRGAGLGIYITLQLYVLRLSREHRRA